MMSVAKVRETPYLTSAQVIGVPSWNFIPSLRVKDQTLPSSVAVPMSVAMSGTRAPASLSSSDSAYWTSVRFR